MKNLTIRNLPDEVATALEEHKRRRGRSLNQTVVDLLAQGLGVRVPRSNGLGRLAGSWSQAEQQEFDKLVSDFEQVDPELWK
jgi:plasmid stability protein